MGRIPSGGQAKKLIGAVDHWLKSSGKGGESVEEQAAALGIELSPAMRTPTDYEIWPENEAAVLLFMRCQTQWRAAGSGLIGLDYGVVLSIMSLYDVPDRGAVLEDLQVMEHRALELLNEQAQREAKRWR